MYDQSAVLEQQRLTLYGTQYSGSLKASSHLSVIVCPIDKSRFEILLKEEQTEHNNLNIGHSKDDFPADENTHNG